MKKLYKVEFVKPLSHQHVTYFIAADKFCELGKRIEFLERMEIIRLETVTYLGDVCELKTVELEHDLPIWKLK